MRIAALNGLLGYGYEQASLDNLIQRMDAVDVIGVDAGSIDPGPYYLGSGNSFTNYSAVKRDLELALPYALKRSIPFIIGTGGGSGSAVHVAWCRSILEEIAREKGLSFNLAIIHTDVDADYVIEKLRAGKVSELEPGLPLTEENIRKCTHIVSQIGTDPFIRVLKEGRADVILAGRACDTAIYSAPAILAGYDRGLALHMAKIMECGALSAEPMSAADILTAAIEDSYFTLEPASSAKRCTVNRVAGHTMYEQSDPFRIVEPEGYADLHNTVYEQQSERVVRVSGSVFVPADQPTLKLEGAFLAGYRTITIAGVDDPATFSRIDDMTDQVRRFTAENLGNSLSPADYTVVLRKYGAAPAQGQALPGTGSAIILDVVGKTQEIANTVCALVRSKLLHTDYPGRKSSAGNLAFPFSPSDIPVGPVYTFGIYHIVQVDDLCETSKISLVRLGGKG